MGAGHKLGALLGESGKLGKVAGSGIPRTLKVYGGSWYAPEDWARAIML